MVTIYISLVGCGATGFVAAMPCSLKLMMLLFRHWHLHARPRNLSRFCLFCGKTLIDDKSGLIWLAVLTNTCMIVAAFKDVPFV